MSLPLNLGYQASWDNVAMEEKDVQVEVELHGRIQAWSGQAGRRRNEASEVARQLEIAEQTLCNWRKTKAAGKLAGSGKVVTLAQMKLDSVGKIVIKDNVFIGHGAIVLPNVTIWQ